MPAAQVRIRIAAYTNFQSVRIIQIKTAVLLSSKLVCGSTELEVVAGDKLAVVPSKAAKQVQQVRVHKVPRTSSSHLYVFCSGNSRSKRHNKLLKHLHKSQLERRLISQPFSALSRW